MKPLSERLNDRLERRDRRSWKEGEAQGWLHAPDRDPEIDELVTLARRLQSTSHLQADPDFASQLERRMLIQHAALSRKQPAHRCFFPRMWHMNPAPAIALGFCLLVLLLGTSMLVVAASITNPANPLYVLKRWEQHVQVSLSNSPTPQAELDLQYARERLHTLASLTNPAHDDAYRQALADLDKQMNDATRAISALSVVPERNRLRNELSSFEAEERHTLRTFLPQLDVPDRLVTTDELGRLGDIVPPGAQLLMDGQVMEAQGSFHNGVYVFMLSLSGNQLPRNIGILNTDDTAAQTTTITMKSSNENSNSNSNSNGNGDSGNNGEHGKGNDGGKPGKAPTPDH